MMSKTALIGFTGFVGSTLLRQRDFSELYRSTNIKDIEGKEFDLVVVAGAPAKKWMANLNPFEDQKALDRLMASLEKVKAKKAILISTVDVFSRPTNIDENTEIKQASLLPYGYNRRRLEIFFKQKFNQPLIVRLPGLVGKGLKKNIIFDFAHKNQIEKIESRNIFQFYPMSNLWKDIERCLSHNLELIHLTAEPVSVSELAREAFNICFDQKLSSPLVEYNFKTRFANLWGRDIPYQYSKYETFEAVFEYLSSENK